MAELTQDELHAIINSDPGLRTMTLEQIAEAYNVSTRSLQRYISSGELRAVRFGRRYLITVAALKEFLSTQRTHTQPTRARSGGSGSKARGTKRRRKGR